MDRTGTAGGEKWLGSECILKVEVIRVAEELDASSPREKKLRMTLRFLA